MSTAPASAGPDWGVVWLGSSGEILSMDGIAERMFGVSAQAVAGRPLQSLLAAGKPFVLPLHAPASGAAAETSATSGHAARLQSRRPDGALVTVDVRVERIPAAVCQPPGFGFVAMVRSLGLKAPAPAPSGLVERQLRALIELSPIAVWVADGERVVFANRAAAKLLGLDSETALIGQSVYALVGPTHHGDLRRRLASVVRQEGQVETLQVPLLGPDREPLEVEIALAGLPNHGRTSVQMVVSNISQRNRELREVQRSRQLFKRLSAHIVEAREEERRHLARELHDELSQHLGALRMDISECARMHGMEAGDGGMPQILAALDGILAYVHRIAANLRPPMLDDLGLGDAIETLSADFSRRMGVRVRIDNDLGEAQVDDKVSIAAYRMVQEALTNVARHAHASEVQIELHRGADELVLSVRDDGVGLPAPTSSPRDSQFGLLGMQERADALGGSLQIENLKEGGVRLLVHLPFEPAGRKPSNQPASSRDRAA